MSMYSALISLARTQRRLAHEYRREALAAEARGNLDWYRRLRRESDRLWTEAKKHVAHARYWRVT